MRVNVFIDSLEPADGVSQDALMLRKALRELGHESAIIVSQVIPEFSNDVILINDYQGNPANVLVIEHSFCTKHFEKLISLPDRKILRYQNITPAKYFKYTPAIAAQVMTGIKQIEQYKPYVQAVWAASNYSKTELEKFGYDLPFELPVPIDWSRFSAATEFNNKTGEFTALCLSRVVENKHQLKVVAAFQQFLEQYQQPTKLYIIGDLHNRPGYVAKIRNFIAKHQLQDRIILTGKVTDAELNKYLQSAHCMISFSEHEGFGMPLIEAMHHQLVVIARNSTAMPGTLRGSGIVVNTVTELTENLIKVARNREFCQAIISGQLQVLEYYKFESIKARLEKLLKQFTANVLPLKVRFKFSSEQWSLHQHEFLKTLTDLPLVSAKVDADGQTIVNQAWGIATATVVANGQQDWKAQLAQALSQPAEIKRILIITDELSHSKVQVRLAELDAERNILAYTHALSTDILEIMQYDLLTEAELWISKTMETTAVVQKLKIALPNHQLKLTIHYLD